ncbi:hypothetical protein CWB98_11290 [Pseudoalteromonas rubra]|uniref:Uncharacterized protein n=1 Tax=Pseudoalteromonas rubra TaxID=43658 RepID=A0A5S3WZG0_9GAMM|nr:hypothetical protein CWB98_11290 [Pseudoalteromonas rubra]
MVYSLYFIKNEPNNNATIPKRHIWMLKETLMCQLHWVLACFLAYPHVFGSATQYEDIANME